MAKTKKNKDSTKYVFITGGVLSGVGKGVTASALGSLLQTHGYKIGSIKCENYMNVDAGTINPIEHGDPFLCNDGLEADMDLGSYERFLDKEMGHPNFTTMGQVYKSVIDKERNMEYEGEDVEAMPHVTNEIKARIKKAGKGNDICLVELGGTAGDYQNALYFEACRQLKQELGDDVAVIHVSYIVFPEHLGEPKTMPTQTSIRVLMSMGVQADFLVLRAQDEMDERRRYLLGIKTSIPADNVIMAADVEHSIYELPLIFSEQKFDRKLLKRLDLKAKIKPNITKWRRLADRIKKEKKKSVKIAIVGKYFSKNKGDYFLTDAYYALIESIQHAGWENKVDTEIKYISSVDLDDKNVAEELGDMDGIVVPIGWGKRGVDGKLVAIKYAREKKVPYLGLCFGMQLAAVEFAQNVCGLKKAHSVEIDPKTKDPIIHAIPLDEKYQQIKGRDVSMRLGAYDCVLKKNTLAEKIYKKYRKGRVAKSKEKKKLKADGEFIISERHRHRFEFNNKYREILEENGMIISGASPDDFFVEMIELEKELHPFFIATQAHPEYKSTPLDPHPMFLEFLDATVKEQKK